MPKKNNTSIWLEPSVQRRLRILAAEQAIPVGDAIKALLDFVEIGLQDGDPKFAKRFCGYLGRCLRDVGSETFFEGANDDEEFMGRIKNMHIALTAAKIRRDRSEPDNPKSTAAASS